MGLFTSSVSNSNQTSNSQATSSVRKPTPRGISATSSSISSQKDDSPGVFRRLLGSIKNVFSSILNALKYIFYRIFPCRSPAYAMEAKHRDFKARLNRVDSIGKELALKEADENPFVYTMLGKHIYKTSWNLPWKIVTWIPKIGQKTYKEIGLVEAEKNFKKLAEQLKLYYTNEMKSLKAKIDNSDF
ncbi:MAG: hypothetical protein K940chlam1_00749 [Candidatus Anoxychlamydiales bacterium]|nr:hypothetical protein [Candidatus Anoxychlamydiales bacterium]NGX35383.1 hypothetical protein [Candidatus Anoxychlamydiales bacterium]